MLVNKPIENSNPVIFHRLFIWFALFSEKKGDPEQEARRKLNGKLSLWNITTLSQIIASQVIHLFFILLSFVHWCFKILAKF